MFNSKCKNITGVIKADGDLQTKCGNIEGKDIVVITDCYIFTGFFLLTSRQCTPYITILAVAMKFIEKRTG